MRTYLKLLPAVFGLCLLASAPACGDDDKDDDSSSEEAVLKPECDEIREACHQADEGTGDAHDCHEIAHTDVVADCVEHRDHCLEVCAGLAGDGGTHTHE